MLEQAGAGAGAAVAEDSGSTFSAETFFATQEPPARLPQLLEGVAEFVAHHAREKRRVVLVTVREARHCRPSLCVAEAVLLVDCRAAVQQFLSSIMCTSARR